MAIWQFDLALIERSAPPPQRCEDCHEVAPLPPVKVVQARNWLQTTLGNPYSFVEDWYVYGSDAGCRVDVLVNDDQSAEISARIDARTDAHQFVTDLCALCRLLDCALFSAEKWCFLEPNPPAVQHALERSRAAAFVRNPIKVLQGR
jgi:hypothetical protein